MRHRFGGNRADWVMEPGEAIQAGETVVAYIPNLLPNEAVTFWGAETGGTQITDLQDPGTGDPLGSSITSDGAGNIPAFLGPDGVTYLWGSASVDGSATRYAMTAVDVGDSFADVTAELDALDTTVSDHGTRITTLEAQPSMDGWHVVTDAAYGATGDGSTDDTAAIQAALDQVQTDGGGTVYVPGGTYSIQTGPLRIYGSTHLWLAPDAVIRRDASGTMLLNGDAAQNFGGYTGHGDLVIEGGTWDANGTVVTGNNMAISIGHAENVTIRNTTILDVPGFHAIELNSTKRGRILNVAALGFIDTGARSFSEAFQVDLAKSSSVFGGFGPYDHTPCEDIVVQSCTVGPSGTAGTTSWGRGVGSHSATATVWHTGIRVIGNRIVDTLEYAVGGYVWDDAIITGNTIEDCGAGIWVRSLDSSIASHRQDTTGSDTGASQPSSRIVIADNLVTGTTGTHDEGMRVQGEATGHVRRATVTGNVIDGVGSGQNGIRAEYLDEAVIASNTATGSGGTGVSTLVLEHVQISTNTIDTPDGSGVTVDNRTGGQHVLVATNRVNDAGLNGIHLLGGNDTELLGNVLVGSSRGTDLANYGIRISSSAVDVLIEGNKVRRRGSGNEAAFGLSVTSTCSEIRRGDNDLTDSGTTGDIEDDTTDRWTAPTLVNSWVNFGGTWQVAEYRKDLSGRVWIRGTIDGGTAGTVAFTLPSGFRPPADFVVAAISSGGSPPDLCRLEVDANGDVIPQNTVGTFVGLDASFDTA
ncbi:hypothetical protein CDO52_13030 [Nocardiopsis gilva YIM 90087]|uniref:Right handed beta helix domain-containing protein n=1 Tax=Nocardiopsis gilva YIM 90087 TaxID=1235441 RepID=A0A223S5Z6_9ACTN|nr:right-handed parallel beta-helix repeat-containing protein [Nocardiopsis gilva]ASU83593.1 hypothetical protein CDO52_13030 [Nocardiopsis gilva YIM 90087]